LEQRRRHRQITLTAQFDKYFRPSGKQENFYSRALADRVEAQIVGDEDKAIALIEEAVAQDVKVISSPKNVASGLPTEEPSAEPTKEPEELEPA